MRFDKRCPICYKYWIDSGKTRWFKAPIKPRVVKQKVEGNEMAITVKYDNCGHEVIIRRPYKNINTIDGYVMVHTAKGYMPEHRFIWEQVHGTLPKGYVIHHINGIKADNRIENLIALPRAEHNNHMMEPSPLEVTCPCCKITFKVIKRSSKELIPI